MKKAIIALLLVLILLLSSCDFIKERFLNNEPLYGGGHAKGTSYTPSPSPSDSDEK
ncbi:MAG: hypothetical protein JXB33_08050 [Clostridia bacterium]|nr:hypothetical protein [Clostridia bacterium]